MCRYQEGFKMITLYDSANVSNFHELNANISWIHIWSLTSEYFLQSAGNRILCMEDCNDLWNFVHRAKCYKICLSITWLKKILLSYVSWKLMFTNEYNEMDGSLMTSDWITGYSWYIESTYKSLHLHCQDMLLFLCFL